MRNYFIKIWDKRSWIALLYALCIVFLLPLYMKNGFVMIGDVKYYFFFYSALFFALVSLFLIFIGSMLKSIQRSKELSYAELFMIFWGVSTLVSCLISPFGKTAVWGYTDWHMGGVTQLMLIFTFFIADKWLGNEKAIAFFAGSTGFLVSVLVISNRCGDDPLGVFYGMDWFEWNRRNLLATIGNINWVCCYLSVSVPILLYFGWRVCGKWRIAGMIGSFIGIAAISLQGSETGFLDLFFFMFLLFWVSLNKMDDMMHFLDLLFLLPFFWSIFSVFQIDIITPNNVDIKGKLYSTLWLIPMAFVIALKMALYAYHKKSRKDIFKSGTLAKVTHVGMVIFLLTGLFLVIICQYSEAVWEFFGRISFLRITDDWGSNRGILWKTALYCYGQLGAAGKLFGVGPDCFGHALEGLQVYLSGEGQWVDAVYANAHNEWLTMLVNEGIMGLACYVGIFASAMFQMFKSIKKEPLALLGILILGGYAINDTFAFQQVMSTPFVFLFLGIMNRKCCEGK